MGRSGAQTGLTVEPSVRKRNRDRDTVYDRTFVGRQIECTRNG